MTKDEALDLALEALEQWITPRWAGTGVDKANAAYTAIKQARSAPVQEQMAWKNAAIRLGEELSSVGPDGYYDMTAEQWLDWALDQRPRGKNTIPPAQEFVCSTGLCHFTLTQTNVGIGERGMQAYEAAKKRGWLGVSDERLMEMPEQSAAAQRQWTGLTDWEISQLWFDTSPYFNEEDFARAIEAKLKEKNNG